MTELIAGLHYSYLQSILMLSDTNTHQRITNRISERSFALRQARNQYVRWMKAASWDQCFHLEGNLLVTKKFNEKMESR